jgi:hypothetical protein
MFGKKVGPGRLISLNSYFGNLDVSINTNMDIKISIPAKILSPVFKFSPSQNFVKRIPPSIQDRGILFSKLTLL